MHKVLCLCLLALFPSLNATAQVVGYANISMSLGDNLVVNPLDFDGTAQHNTLNTMFGTQAPEGTSISLWNSGTRSFEAPSYFVSGAWSQNLSVSMGQGMLVNAPSPFTNAFVGNLLTPAGDPYSPFHITFPHPYTGPNGIFFLGNKCPVYTNGNGIFEYVLGRDPNIGEQVTALDRPSQIYTTSTYLGGGSWDVLPSLHIGEALFFNIGPVPEPSSAALLI